MPEKTKVISGRSHLSLQKQAVLEKLLRGELASVPDKYTISRRSNPNEPAPLSYAQQRLWFLWQMEPENPFYNVPLVARLKGNLNIEALVKSFEALVQRHEILRTTYSAVDGQPRQIIASSWNGSVNIKDLGTLPEPLREAEAQRLANEETQRPFDLTHESALRVCLIRLEEQEYVLLITFHHSIDDAWSLGIVVRELKVLYEGYTIGKSSPLQPLPIQYADFAAWQRNWLEGGELDRQLSYWRRQLGVDHPLLELPTDRPRPAVQTYKGASYEFPFDADLVRLLNSFAQRYDITSYMVLLSAFKILLYRYTRQTDLRIGVLVANRTRPELEGLVGFFVNNVVMRTDLTGNPTVEEVLRQVKTVTLDGQAHQDLPFERLVEELNPPRSLAYHPLFQVVHNHNWLQNGGRLELEGVVIERYEYDHPIAEFDLMLSTIETGEQLLPSFRYSTDLFNRETIERMSRHWMTVLRNMLASPTERIDQLSLLDEAAQEEMLQKGAELSFTDIQQLQTLSQLFEAQVARTPEAVAVVCEDKQLTYGELNGRANQLAHYLQGQGVGPDVLVGLCMERSVELVVSLLGILKAGGAYVPIDPSYPADRITYMLEDSHATLLLTEHNLREILPSTMATVVCLDRDWSTIAQESSNNPLSQAGPESLAYIIYTSGSTGRPKGVMVPHGNVVRLFATTQEWFHFDGQDTWTLFHSYAFDFSVWELWGALLYGGRLVVVPYWVSRSPEQFYDLLCQERVTVLNQTPSAFRQLVQVDGMRAGHDELALRVVIFGGEALDPISLGPWFERHGDQHPRLVNMYGITETTVHVTYCPVTSGMSAVPAKLDGGIGRGIPDLQLYLLGPTQQLVPIGVPGEIYVGGAGLARGYLNRPELTAERFIPNPYGTRSGERLYRTGDAGRWEPDGQLTYVGRVDQQVKVRGFRIELGEIEARLLEHPAVQAAVVLAREDEQEEKYLVAYVVPAASGAVTVEEVRARLGQVLPDYMVPAHVMVLEQLPLTPNGKVDRRALPAPDLQRGETGYVAPRTPTEAQLATIWAEVLKRDKVGVEDNFFTLGGHSLLAITLLERMRQAGLATTVRALFAAPTIAGLARTLGQDVAVVVPPNRIPAVCEELTPEMLTLVQFSPEQIATVVATVPGGARNVQDIYPLVPLQEGILFHHLLHPTSDVYLLSVLLGFDTRERVMEFLTALQVLIDRHDMLRTAVVWEGLPEPVQVVWRQALLLVEELELDGEAKEAAEWLRARCDPRHYRLDVRQAPLLRGILVKDVPKQRWLLQLVYHHLISDHTTLELLIHDVQIIMQGETVQLPALVPFRNFVAQARLGLSPEAHEAFFTQMLAEVDEPTLPFGLQDVHHNGSAIDEARCPVEAGLAQRVHQQARRLKVSVASIMHLAWAQVVARVSGRSDVVFGTVLFGRLQGDVGADRVGGMLLNTLPIRINVGQVRVAEGVQATHRLLTKLLRHEQASLVLAQRCSGVAAPMPLFSALLNYRHSQKINPSAASPAWNGMTVLKTDVRNNYPLTLSIDDWGEGFDLTVLVSAGIQAQRVCGYMHRAVEQLITALETAPETPLCQGDILPVPERTQLLREWNETTVAYPDAYPDTQTIHQWIEAQASRTPAAVAVVCEDEHLTYAELNVRANQVAHGLRARGVGPGIRVGLCLERSLDLVVGIWGILKAGGAYVPMEPTLPPERLMGLLQDAGVAGVLTHAAVAAETRAALASIQLWEMASLLGEAVQAGRDENLPAPDPENLAYLIYTSGSTGQPKGVAVAHHALVNYVSSVLARMAVPELAMQWALLSTVAADLGHTMLFGALCAGRTLHLLSTERGFHPEQMAEYMQREQIDVLKLTPGHLAGLLDATQPEQVLPRHCLVLGGEALPWTLVERIQALAPHCAIINHYGPTEATVGALTHRIEAQVVRQGATVPIGRPLAHSRAYILDRDLEPVPVGVPGELYLGGTGLAQGYHAQPGLTAERFVPDPFVTQASGRLYRTGDQARYREDGTIEFLGRQDHQVKLRGYRIELGEIEAQLRQHSDVHEAVVVVRENRAEVKQLVAYVVARPGHTVQPSVLRVSLARHLPDYMVPQAFVSLEAFPLTRNGKLDRAALPDPEIRREGGEAERDAAPQTEMEQMLAAIWAEVLRRESVGRHDNFFELGGDSILSLQIIARAHRRGLKLTPKQLFDQPTVAGLASVAVLRRQDSDTSSNMPVLGTVPLTPIQHWFFEAQHPNPHHWNQAVLLEVRQSLDFTWLTQAVQALVAHHDALRLRFHQNESGQWMQTYAAKESHPICERVDLAALEQEQLRPWPEILEGLATEAHQKLHIIHGPLVRVVYFDRGPDETDRLLLIIHHLVVDGVSWRILIEDLQMAYRQLEQGQLVSLPAKATSMKSWREHLGSYADSESLRSELDYWTGEGATRAHFPCSVTVEDNRVGNTVTVTVSLSVEETHALLHDVPPVYRTEINDILLTALAQTLCGWSGQSSLRVELEGHGREDLFDGVDVSQTVGWFTTRFPVTLMPGTAEPGAAIQAIKAQLRRIPKKGIGYGILRYLSSDATIRGNFQALPHPLVTFNYLGQIDASFHHGGLFTLAPDSAGISRDPQSKRQDFLAVNAFIVNQQLWIDWTYPLKKSDARMLEDLAHRYVEILQNLIAHCTSPESGGATSSDFSLAGLSDTELNKILEKIK
ncbi:MAG: amino acid adenylation domain-containing protein [Nitrospira sp.]|nr:amino acid adenylation domain-containing protein [Nitrospira sp.]